MNENCLLIVDPQNDFFPGGALGVTNGHEIIDPINKMIQRAVKNGWTIIVTGDQHPETMPEHFKKWPVHCVKGTIGAMFHKDLRIPSCAYILSKGMGTDNDAYSAFDEEAEVKGMNLALFLKTSGIRNLYACGLATDWCVKETVFHALDEPFLVNVNLVTDAIRAVNLVPNAGLQSIMEMVAAGAKEVTSKDEPVVTPKKDQTINRLIEETMDAPIVDSAIADDFYKITMGLFIEYFCYSDVDVEWRFKNRTISVKLPQFVSEKEFQNEISHFRGLRITGEEFDYLNSIPGLKDHPTTLYNLVKGININKVPEVNLKVNNDGQFDISWVGKWIPSQRLEIPTLRIINGLYYRTILRNMNSSERKSVFETGVKNLYTDIKLVLENPTTKIVEFANRRSFAGPWHKYVTTTLRDEIGSQLLGTSKVSLARELNIPVKGTIAHEMSMVLSALGFDGTEESLKSVFIKLHEDWFKLFGRDLSIILTDTFGTAKCLEWLPAPLVEKYKGMRIDSKEPNAGAQELIDYYEKFGMDPMLRAIMPSDGLSVRNSIDLVNKFGGKTNLIPCIGTNLSNNMGLRQLSIVVKTYRANDKFCVKLSDNIAKATGDPKTVERYKKALGYVESYRHETVV